MGIYWQRQNGTQRRQWDWIGKRTQKKKKKCTTSTGTKKKLQKLLKKPWGRGKRLPERKIVNLGEKVSENRTTGNRGKTNLLPVRGVIGGESIITNWFLKMTKKQAKVEGNFEGKHQIKDKGRQGIQKRTTVCMAKDGGQREEWAGKGRRQKNHRHMGQEKNLRTEDKQTSFNHRGHILTKYQKRIKGGCPIEKDSDKRKSHCRKGSTQLPSDMGIQKRKPRMHGSKKQKRQLGGRQKREKR